MAQEVPVSMAKLLVVLKQLTPGEVLSNQDLADRALVSTDVLRRYSTKLGLQPYKIPAGRNPGGSFTENQWSHPNTVADTLATRKNKPVKAVPAPAPQEIPQPTAEEEDTLLCQQATIRQLEADNRKLRLSLAQRREEARIVAGAVTPLAPIPAISRKQNSLRPETTLLLAFSDFHLGEIVLPQEMGGVNNYNLEVARDGLLDIVRRILQWTSYQRHGYTIDKAQVLCLGDLIGGGIHPELAANAEVPAPVATAKAGALLAEAVAMLAQDFGQVDVTCVAGNHDRLAQKTPFKRTNVDSLSHLAYIIARESLGKQKHVHFDLSEDAMPVVEVQGRMIACMHGHQIKATGVSPYYGIARRAAAMAHERSGQGKKPPDHILIGHFHHHSTLNDQQVILVPSLIGETEYGRALGLSGAPAQFACLVGEHGLHGLTCFERRTGR